VAVYSEQIDYELELAVIIGAKARCIDATDAPACIGGYTIANDVSARSVTFSKNRQKRPWTSSTTGSTASGPTASASWAVPGDPDEIAMCRTSK